MPFISLILPCYNEELFIEKCIESIIQNDYPHDKIEILIIDGLSKDNTVRKAESIIENNSDISIRLLSNIKKTFPCAVNLGVKSARGDLIMILGAHAVYDKTYISKCAESLIKYDVDNVGGILKTEGLNKNAMGKSISNVLSSKFGVGNSDFRTGTDKIKEVDTVFGGCYKKAVFEKIGLFNENLTSTSDMDFNIRLKRAGGKILLVPTIIVTYFTRNNFRKFNSNNWRNGYWAIYPMRFVNYLPVSIRHLIPLIFIFGILSGTMLSFLSQIFLIIFLSVLLLYLIFAILFSVQFIKKGFYNIFLMPFLFFLLHITYGSASFWAGLKVIVYKFSDNNKQNNETSF